MPTRLTIAPAARQALDDIFDFIDAESPQAAQRFVAMLRERLEKGLTTFPLMGPVFQGPVRVFVIEGYAFLYRYVEEQDEVRILKVFGRGQNWR